MAVPTPAAVSDVESGMDDESLEHLEAEMLSLGGVDVDEALRLAYEGDRTFEKIAEIERRAKEHEALAERDAFDTGLFATTQELVCEAVKAEILQVTEALARRHDNAVSMIRETLLEGCLESTDKSMHSFVTSVLASE